MRINLRKIVLLLCLFCAAAATRAQEHPAVTSATFEQAADSVRRNLRESIDELNRLREQLAAEKIPLSHELNRLEDELGSVRREYQQAVRLLDSRTLDLSNLRGEIKARDEEAAYLSTLFGDYIRNFESRLHVAELQRYADALKAAKLAPENSNLSPQVVYAQQAALLELSLDRLHDALGGVQFKGTAVNENGIVKSGAFVLAGPAAIFRSADGADAGSAEQRLGSLEPTVSRFGLPEDARAAASLIASGTGEFPLDPTLGNARKIEQTHETLLEHVRKGGPVMIPIFALAGAALLVALFKWLSMAFIRTPPQRRIRELLAAVARHERKTALQIAQTLGGPTGRMLTAGVEHLKEPRELIEEVMYEQVLAARLKLNRFLSFIAVSAASAPLLGLLGTVTGIINTFKLITVFGTGDVKTLSGGISEALITTEFGLIVAIPSLLIHALLSRKARGVIDQMEQAAIALLNQVGKTPYKHTNIAQTEERQAAGAGADGALGPDQSNIVAVT